MAQCKPPGCFHFLSIKSLLFMDRTKKWRLLSTKRAVSVDRIYVSNRNFTLIRTYFLSSRATNISSDHLLLSCRATAGSRDIFTHVCFEDFSTHFVRSKWQMERPFFLSCRATICYCHLERPQGVERSLSQPKIPGWSTSRSCRKGYGLRLQLQELWRRVGTPNGPPQRWRSSEG